jgi:hypothetical protein
MWVARVVAALLLLCVVPIFATPCAPPPSLQHGDVINVALLVWLPNAPYGLCDGDMMDQPGTDIKGSYGTNMVQPHLLGQERCF